jgi:hypothetical protein
MRPAVEHDRRAMQHRPTDPEQLAREIRRLHRTGLSPIDVATALRADLAMVREVLRAT